MHRQNLIGSRLRKARLCLADGAACTCMASFGCLPAERLHWVFVLATLLGLFPVALAVRRNGAGGDAVYSSKC